MIDPEVFELIEQDEKPHAEFEVVQVPAHQTRRMTIIDQTRPLDPRWVFTYAKTGCLRVQRGDFCAYVPVEVLGDLRKFLALRPGGGE